MRKFAFVFAACVLMSVFLTSCANSNVEELQKNVTALQTELETIKLEKDNLQIELEILKNEKAQLSLELAQLKNSKLEEEKQKTIENSDVTVKVSDLKKIAKDSSNWVFSNRVEFSIDIQNNTDKEIQGIQGKMDIQDMFGKSIVKVNCDLTEHRIKPGEMANNSNLGFDINDFMDDHVKVYTTDFENLIFVYTPSKILFTDGSMKE